ncbi:MAG TPA: hypothetical protein DEB45_17360, partial [Alteromonas australica]|nr:hypothetical protein [Alteromonas australica]
EDKRLEDKGSEVTAPRPAIKEEPVFSTDVIGEDEAVATPADDEQQETAPPVEKEQTHAQPQSANFTPVAMGAKPVKAPRGEGAEDLPPMPSFD